ncbi:hypothetical protein JTY60_01570 [symbiont of Argiope bruennichi]|uniref:hypothetical protein n=1 Tax=symbiont of Argiope bruennichi TaxID=2810479 RepID=UPI003DA333AE
MVDLVYYRVQISFLVLMIKKNFSKKTKSFLLIFLSSFFLASCAEDKPKWYDKYLNKANSIFSDYDTYSKNYQNQIIGEKWVLR